MESLTRKIELVKEIKVQRERSENLLVVLMVDDDEDDFILVDSAFAAGPMSVDLRWVPDGQEAMDYLLRRGNFNAPESSPRPDLILLDINMPRKDGLQTLKEIKADYKLHKIPVVLLTTATKEEHEASGLRLGADSFITKPDSFEDMVNILSHLHEHYFGIIRLPGAQE
jgi:CheY-like chemotaxis protein